MTGPVRWLRHHLADEGANTLVLVPVAVVILLGLAALALDAAVLYLGQRRLADLAAAAATDAAGALDPAGFYEDELPERLDPDAGQARAAALAANVAEHRGFERVVCMLDVEGLTATVRCDATVRPLLAPFWPGMDGAVRLSATEHAAARDG